MKDYANPKIEYSGMEYILGDLRPDVSDYVYDWLDTMWCNEVRSMELLEKIEQTMKDWKKLNRVPFKELKEALSEITEFVEETRWII